MTTINTINIANQPQTELTTHQLQTDDGMLFWERQKALGRIPTSISYSRKTAKANIQLNERIKDVFDGVNEGNKDKIESAFSKGMIPSEIRNAAILKGVEKTNPQVVETLLIKEGHIPKKTLYIALEFGLNEKDPIVIKICLQKLGLSRQEMVSILEKMIEHNYLENLNTLLDRIHLEPTIYAYLITWAMVKQNKEAVNILLKQSILSHENPQEDVASLKELLEKFDDSLSPNKSEFIFLVLQVAIARENYEIITTLLNTILTPQQLANFLIYAGKNEDLTILKTVLEMTDVDQEELGKHAAHALYYDHLDAAEVFLEKGLLPVDLRNDVAVLATEKGYTSILSHVHKKGSLSFESYSKAIRIAFDKRNFEHVMILLYNNASHVQRNLFELIQHTKATIQEIGLTTEMQTILILLLQEYWLS